MEESAFNYSAMFKGDCKNIPEPKTVFLTDPLRLVGMFLYAGYVLQKTYDLPYEIESAVKIEHLENWIEEAADYLPRWCDAVIEEVED